MTYSVSRDGRNLGTFSEEGLSQQLGNGVLLPTDMVFLEKEQKWCQIAEMPEGDAEQAAGFTQKLELATPHAFVTPALVIINLTVFAVMAISGVSILEPKPADLIRWGADFGPLVAHGQWWRLLTAAFVHVGILHIMLNMWALLSGGMFTERLFGNGGFLTLYLLSAIGGSLTGLSAQPFVVAAGASGAIFGVYGGLLGLLAMQHKSIPRLAVDSLGKNALAFVGYNILFGLRPGSNIDVAAHLGGLATGLVAGCALAYRTDPAQGGTRPRRSLAVMLIGLALFVPVGLKLRGGDKGRADSYSAEMSGKTLTIGKSDRIIYSGNVTDTEAQHLGQVLKRIGFMQDRGVLVLYRKDQMGPVLSLIVKEEGWQNPKLASSFQFLGVMISGAMGTPLKMQLLSKDRELKKEFVLGKKGSGSQEARE
jgi:membrane associated rhomboid family serine protease